MLDIKLIRNNPKNVEKLLKSKDPSVSLEKIIELDEKIRNIRIKSEILKKDRNYNSKEISKLKQQNKCVKEICKKMKDIGDEICELDKNLLDLEKILNSELSYLPNIPFQDVKSSLDPIDNVCIKSVGDKPVFSFTAKNHLQLNESLNLFDFKRGAKIGGSGWPAYRALGARLEWALINFMIDKHISNGFEQWMLPVVAKYDIMFGSAHLPKFDQSFKIEDDKYKLYLIPTSEVVLNGLHYDEIIDFDDLPLKYISYTPCFRREAGAAGSKTSGLIRTHQFNKVEMFCITHPEDSARIYDEMVCCAESILEELDLHYRSMVLVTGDMSFASAKTIDLEVWIPGNNRYYEVSSISNCTDFQARRSQMRFKKNREKPEFVHTLNGSGLATSRLMVALLENNQQKDGSVVIPLALRKYLGGLDKLTPKTNK